MGYLNSLFTKFGKKAVLAYAAVLAILVVIALSMIFSSEETQPDEARLPGVQVESVSSLSGSGTLSLVGTVASVSEVKLESEAGGRITRVPVTLGQSVAAGTVIASIENSSEAAAVLQAEGAYEAALAAAAQSDVSVEDAEAGLTAAKQAAINTNRSALSSWNSVLSNTVDEVFANPRVGNPAIRLSAAYQKGYLTNERTAFRDELDAWQKEIDMLSSNDSVFDISNSLESAVARTDRLREMVRVLSSALASQDPDQVFSEADITSLRAEFATAESTLNTTRTQLQSAASNLVDAEDALKTAEISGTGGSVSSADAAVKQALGSLRAAQATYSKTIIRTPIAGTINSLSVKTGDYVGQGTFVANIANNNASIITTYIGDTDRDRVSIGQEVIVNGNASGTITAIAPGVDPATKKAEVEIQSEDNSLINGASVRIEIPGLTEAESVATDLPIIIPVSALKVETDRVLVFTLNSDNVLVANEVKTGTLQGTHITIESGLTPDMEIVTDARGLKEGDQVNILD